MLHLKVQEFCNMACSQHWHLMSLHWNTPDLWLVNKDLLKTLSDLKFSAWHELIWCLGNYLPLALIKLNAFGLLGLKDKLRKISLNTKNLLLDTIKTTFWEENLYQRWAQSGLLFSKIRVLFSIFKRRAGEAFLLQS